MNIEDLVIVKRTTKSNRHKPILTLQLNGNRFIFNYKVVDKIGLKSNEGVMFGFNFKEQTAYILKDDEDDAFILKQKGKDDRGLRFASKALAKYFINCFKLKTDNKGIYQFDIKEKNKKGGYQISLAKK